MCPYSNFEPATVSFCEERLCAWIQSPADTISNIGYFVVAFLLFSSIRRDKRADLKPIAIAALCVGVGSTLFHATGTFWAEFLDVGSMFLFSAFLITRNLYRLGAKHEKIIYWSIVISSLVTLFINHPIGINLFIGHITVAVILEIVLGLKGVKTNRDPLFALGMVFAASYLLWWVDQLKLVCDPSNHWLQFHGWWHLLNTYAFYYAYKFYKNAR